MNHIKSLDGLRGIAVLSVLFFHSPFYTLQGGFLGVDLFFVLSGFLITSIIYKNFHIGTFTFKNFYLKRILRLMPAVITMMLFLWMLIILFPGTVKTDTHLMATTTLYIFTYLSNWIMALNLGGWPKCLDHFWSLAIEEQFYLIWPIVLVVLLKLKVSIRNIIIGLITLTLLVMFWRNYLWFSTQHNFTRSYFATDTRVGALLIGCATSLLFQSNKTPLFFIKRSSLFLILSVTALMFCLFNMNNGSTFTFAIGLEIVAVTVSILIISLLYSNTFIKRIFELNVLTWTGMISYGIYLWHPVVSFVFEKSTFLNKHHILFTITYIVVSISIAALSFYIIEKRFLNYKKRLTSFDSNYKTRNVKELVLTT